MGLFDRFTRNPGDRRNVEVVGPNGEDLNKFEYKGLWAQAVGALTEGNTEIGKIRPKADDSINMNAVASRCVDLIVDSLSSRDIEVVDGNGEPVDHYLETLWNESPNPSQSARLFKKSVWYRIMLHGEAIVILDRGASRVDAPKSAHLHYGKTKVRLSKATPQAPQGDILAYEIQVGETWYTLAPTEVLWLREPDPANPWKSRAPISAALESIGLARAARGWQAGQLLNGANPNGIVQVLGTPSSEEEYYLIRDEIEAALTGPSSAGRIATVASPLEVKFTPTSMNAQEVAYLDTLKLTDEQIANALGVPLDLIGGQRTYQNLDAAWRILWEGTLLPRLEIIASEMNRQALVDTEFTARFITSDITALQEGQDALTARVTKATEGDIVTLDEARAKLGFGPMENGMGALTISAYKAALGITAAPAARTGDPVSETRSEANPNSFRLATGPLALVCDIDDTLIKADGSLNVAVADYVDDFDGIVCLITGRSVEDHDATVAQLAALDIDYDELHERDFGTGAQTNEYKAYKIGKLMETYNVTIAIDNDAEARKAYKEAGVALVVNPTDIVAADQPDDSDSDQDNTRAVSVPEYIRLNAKRGLDYLEEGFGGEGLTDQTIAEARDIAAGSISDDKVRRIAPWIARHLVDLEAPANNDPENPGYPGNGLVAHLLWGSGPDRATANRVRRWAEREAAKFEKAAGNPGLHVREVSPEKVERTLDRLEARTQRAVEQLAAAQLREANKRIQRGQRDETLPADAKIAFNEAAWTERGYEYFFPLLSAAAEEGYAITAGTLDADLLGIDKFIESAVDARTQVLVGQVNDTTAKVLQERLTASAVADRVSVVQYREILEKTFGELSTYRAETIARTEMIGTYNGASRQAAVDSGVPIAREWLAVGANGSDDRTRPSHVRLDGERTTSMNDPYSNGLMYPGDPSGPASETVNCRCVELYVTDYTPEGNK